MNSDPSELGRLFTVLVTGGFFGWLFWSAIRRRRPASLRHPVDDEPEGTPYRVFTRDFDVIAWARDVPALLESADRFLPPGRQIKVPTWPARLAVVDKVAEIAAPTFRSAAARLIPTLASVQGKAAVMLLVDQSGSTHQNILSVVPSIRWLSETLTENDVPFAVAGFTTLGWQGGAARRRWLAKGLPGRPGRLCALLHIWYRNFDGPLAADDLDAMSHPDVLRENIDGEAIQWAISELLQREEPAKLLIVLSDGAPVDDSSITENGSNFLVRHLLGVIQEAEKSDRVRLGAIGIGHRVDEYYARTADATDLTKLPSALVDVIEQLVRSKPLESS